jgi:RES domain-containing protein
MRAVYCALEPATAILEVAVHKTFRVLDTTPHVLTSLEVTDPASIHVVGPDDVPNANWLRPGIPSAGQQAFGDELLSRHAFVLLPSAVSARSWNLLFDPLRAKGGYRLIAQEAFALDTRLHPPAA